MNAEERLGQVLAALRQLEFKQQAREGKVRRFKGALKTSKGPVKVELRLADVEFTTYPVIRLAERPDFLPKLMPHVDNTGGICYFARGTKVLDRFNPGGATVLCVEQAERVLNEIVTHPERAYKDALDEFLVYWHQQQNPPVRPVLLGNMRKNDPTAACYRLGEHELERILLTQDMEEARATAEALGEGDLTALKVACWLFHTDSGPVMTRAGLPTTVGEFFSWLKEWDEALYRDIAFRLERDSEYLKKEAVYIAVDSPLGVFGIRLPLDPVHRISYKSKPAGFKNFLHGPKGQPTKIQRLMVLEIGTDFIHSRNISHPDLRDKRITLIGCGSIGGYIAQALVRLGAGTGKHGCLTLVDGDLLMPDNLGRHYLGLPAILEDKAEALKDELLRQFPQANINAVAATQQGKAALFNEHLVINATGEEAFGEMINDLHVQRLKAGGRPACPVMHVWIKGEGECCQALWVDTLDYACYRCRKNPNGKTGLEDRHPVLKEVKPLKRVGCQAITPYAVSAPMTAAGLAIDMVAAWLNGNVSPRFRTRCVESANVFKVPNKNLERIDGCPACSPRH